VIKDSLDDQWVFNAGDNFHCFAARLIIKPGGGLI